VRAALLVAALLSASAVAFAQGPAQSGASSDLPTITYRRVFEGSTPEFVEIVVRQDGAAKADVRQLSEAATPQAFTVNAAISKQIFDLARQLRKFQNADWEVRRKVAVLGRKTFRWEQDAEAYQTEYNYTINPQAAQLQKIFDNLAQEQTDLAEIEHRARYDRLGVNESLERFEQHLNQGTVPGPERFLPALDRIVEDARLIEMARQRARTLAARIRVMQSR